MTTTARGRRPRTVPRACPWTAAQQHSVVRDLQWLVQPPGWTSLGACGIQVAVRYHSAEPGLRIGGDWHLSMPLANGDLLLAIGDVAGHGLTAACEMVGLRYAMASLALAVGAPAAILEALNAAVCRHGEITATAIVARLCPGSGELTWAQAGHLPILAAGTDGVSQLPSPDGIMLGVDPTFGFGQGSTYLDRGDYLVMYTDGVLRRSDSIDQGIAALASLAATARCCPPSLLDHVTYDAAGDDACVLVAERVR